MKLRLTTAAGVATALLASAAAVAAQAQDFPSSVFSTGTLDEFLRSGRNRDLNPTGFGKPGEYWSIPTGTRIARGARPKATPKVVTDSQTGAATTTAPATAEKPVPSEAAVPPGR